MTGSQLPFIDQGKDTGKELRRLQESQGAKESAERARQERTLAARRRSKESGRGRSLLLFGSEAGVKSGGTQTTLG